MINIIAGIVTLFLVCLVLWGIGKMHWSTEGLYVGNIWSNIWHGFEVLIIVAFLAGVVFVIGYILYVFGGWIIHLIW